MEREDRKIVQWLGGHGHLMLAAVLVVVGGVLGFLWLLDTVEDGHARRFDEWAIRYSYEHQGPPWLQEVGRDLTALGGMAVLALVTLAVAGYLWIVRKRGAMWVVLIATLGGLLLSTVLKKAVDRPRPNLYPHGSYVYTTSFPSGHSMLSATVYLTLGSLLARVVSGRGAKFYFIFVALALSCLVGVSRVYLRVHWPTDVLAGWCAGLTWALLCWLVTRYLQQRRLVEQDSR